GLAGAAGGIVFGLSVLTMPALPVAFGAGLTALGFGCAAAYLRHVRKVAVPLIAPSLFRIPTYAAAIYAGSFFRVAVGATPFLLPLMLQLGFGMTAFESGMVTCVIAIGALSVKFGVAKLYRRIGFRVSLTAAIIVTCATIAAMGFFTPSTSLIFMFGVLILTGFTRSTFFTGVNALTYADVPPEDASQATAMSAVAQQVSLALGVAFAAGILELRILFAGTSLTLADFHMAFFIIAAVGLIAVVFTLRLPADAGASVSGHQRAGVQPSSGA
ncbi:MAG: MFS transporter, partial [Pseudomonadota bacterium]